MGCERDNGFARGAVVPQRNTPRRNLLGRANPTKLITVSPRMVVVMSKSRVSACIQAMRSA